MPTDLILPVIAGIALFMKKPRPRSGNWTGSLMSDRYFMSQRIKTLKAIRAKISPERCASRCLRHPSNVRHYGQ